MTTDPELIWYASYGSNLSLNRFMCYVQGGQAEGSTLVNPGCRDKTPPRSSAPLEIHHELYFARADDEWGNGGVAFVRNKTDNAVTTLGRKYLITKEQFTDVINQENASEGPLAFDFNAAEAAGGLVVRKNAWYGRVLFLGRESGHPIFTFTSEDDLDGEINAPSVPYLATIARGLLEAHNLGNDALAGYFSTKAGIRGWPIEQGLRLSLDEWLSGSP